MERKPLPGIKVLIADDNSLNRMVTRSLLQKWGIAVTEVADGEEAFRHFRQDQFDILLFDLDMPGMDGLTALREVRKTDNQVPVIAFSGSEKKDISSEFTDFLPKPFTPDELYEKISAWAPARKG